MNSESRFKSQSLGLLIEYISRKTRKNWWFMLIVIGVMILFLALIAFLLSSEGTIKI